MAKPNLRDTTVGLVFTKTLNAMFNVVKLEKPSFVTCIRTLTMQVADLLSFPVSSFYWFIVS